jgi:hypothetical protein
MRGKTAAKGDSAVRIAVLPDVAFAIEHIDSTIDVVREKPKNANPQNSIPIAMVYYTLRFIWVRSRDIWMKIKVNNNKTILALLKKPPVWKTR